ncbi:MAG: hypothetical protein MJ252_04210 [archaeon]|nr:hypothetical protein [archaeon]
MYKSAEAYSFGKSGTKKVPAKNFLDSTAGKPEAGKYQNILYKSNTPKYGFLKDKKLKGPKSDTPGVGKYNITTNKSFGQGPKFSEYQKDKETDIGEKVRKTKRKATPGPGKYDSKLDIVKPRTIAPKFSKLKKDINYDNKRPGVGQYNTESNKDFGKGEKNKFTISKSQRSKLVDESKTSSSAKNKNDIKALEPGKYDIKSSIGSGRKALLRGKPKELPRCKTPGPGSYRYEDAKMRTLKKSPSYGIGIGNKTNIIRKDNKAYPGPGKYTLREGFDVSDKGKIKANTFAKDKRMKEIRFKTPGPGHYKLPCSFGYTAPYSGIENHYV